MCFLLAVVFRYRRQVIETNLEKAFPEKSDRERAAIRRQFYHHLCDLLLETFKTLTCSPAFAKRHCRFDPDTEALFRHYATRGQSIFIVMGHYGNWEWAGNSFSLLCKQPLYVIYHPVKNRYFNRFTIRMRKRFGTGLIPMKEVYRELVKHKDQVSATAFIADQTPSSSDNAYWTRFMNQDTPVFRGTELLAKKLNYPVIFASVNRLRRGYYEMTAQTIFETPAATAEGEISEAHTRMLEAAIHRDPANWLWSHRRWKRKKPE